MKSILKNINDASLAVKQLGILKFETKTGKRITYKFSCVKNIKRTLSQNNYYWAVVLKVIASETGHTTEELHEYFKNEYLINRFEEKKVLDKTIVVETSTTKLSTKVFTKYIEDIRRFASAELGCYIPDANESKYMEQL